MVDPEGGAGVRPRLEIILIFAVLLVESLDKADICCLRELGLLVNQCKNVHWLLSNHVERRLVVDEGNFLPVDPLFGVLLLLHLENVLHKKLLEIFVCIIDAELFETVLFKILKSEDVQNPNSAFVTSNFSFENCSVYFLNVRGLGEVH